MKDHPTQPRLYKESLPLERSNYAGYQPGTTILTKGSVQEEGHALLPCDILYERDVPVTMRDGIKVMVDIYRPTTDEKVPVIVHSSIFGKNRPMQSVDSICAGMGRTDRLGIPKSWTSGLETFEASDPGFWVPNGYAICNIDIRGVDMSEGDVPYQGYQEAEDAYDVIEWLAAQPWCSGKVSMSGNSWLGVIQWHTGSLCPPHLTCLAPWEGLSDSYRDEMMAGGIPNPPATWINAVGRTRTESMGAAVDAYPLLDGFWLDKAPDVSKITVPAYVVASWTSSAHAQGTLRAWKNLGSQEKWLRVHNRQEWTDLYNPYNCQELLRFFDHYMKGINNGWENTPRIRLSVLDPGNNHNDTVNRIEDSFPIERQILTKLYLNPENMSLTQEKPEEGTVSYCGDDWESVLKFSMEFQEETEITGYMNLVLWAESDEYDDMDISVKVSKVGPDGNYLYHDAIMRDYSGPDARHRASLRKLDPHRSRPEEPYYTYDTVEKLTPHVPVELQIGLWPTGMKFHPGEKLEVAICGFDYELPAMGPDPNFPLKIGFDNKGNHILHVGGGHASFLYVPFIPEKQD